MDFSLYWFLYIVLGISVTVDIRSQRIPNWLSYPSILSGIIYHTGMKGLDGFTFSIEGVAIGILLLLIPYLLGGMGAGDAKLLGVVGAFLGPKGVLIAFVFTAIVGGIYALAILIFRRYLIETIKRYGGTLKTFIFTREFIYIRPTAEEKRTKLYYGVAIALGTIISVVCGGALESYIFNK